MFQSTDWRARCEHALREFQLGMDALLSDADRARGGFASEDRCGAPLFFPFPTLSIGAVVVEAPITASHMEVSAAAAEAKRQAKRLSGNSLFVERRRVFRRPGDLASGL